MTPVAKTGSLAYYVPESNRILVADGSLSGTRVLTEDLGEIVERPVFSGFSRITLTEQWLYVLRPFSGSEQFRVDRHTGAVELFGSGHPMVIGFTASTSG